MFLLAFYSVEEAFGFAFKIDSSQMHRIKPLFSRNMQQTTEI